MVLAIGIVAIRKCVDTCKEQQWFKAHAKTRKTPCCADCLLVKFVKTKWKERKKIFNKNKSDNFRFLGIVLSFGGHIKNSQFMDCVTISSLCFHNLWSLWEAIVASVQPTQSFFFSGGLQHHLYHCGPTFNLKHFASYLIRHKIKGLK